MGSKNKEEVKSKTFRSKLRIVLFILALIIPVVTFAYSYMWSSKWNENVWDGFFLDYFNPFIIGVAIAFVLLAFCILLKKGVKPFGKKVSLIFGVIAFILVLWICVGQGLFSSHREQSKWDQLSEEEKEWYRENGETIMEMQEWVEENE